MGGMAACDMNIDSLASSRDFIVELQWRWLNRFGYSMLIHGLPKLTSCNKTFRNSIYLVSSLYHLNLCVLL